MKNLLFISHENSRTGAPLILLQFMQWIKANKPNISMDLLALKEGALSDEFKAICKNYYSLESIRKVDNVSYFNKIINGLTKNSSTKKENLLYDQLAKNKYDLIYVNTIASVKAGQLIKKNSKTPLLAHIHELKTVIELSKISNESILSIDHIVAVSELVKNNLVKQWAFPKDNLSVIYEFAQTTAAEIILVPKTSFIVGASGQVHWRKSPDIFLQVARYIFKKQPHLDIKFEWVGHLTPSEKIIIENDVLKLGLKNKVHFVGEVKNPIDYFKNFDVFLMPSREDPFPLVCIEVASLGVPIIAFQQATGTIEILQNGGGKIVPYLDIEAMAEEILCYYNHPEIIQSDGIKAKSLFSKFTSDNICPQLFEVCEKIMISA